MIVFIKFKTLFCFTWANGIDALVRLIEFFVIDFKLFFESISNGVSLF